MAEKRFLPSARKLKKARADGDVSKSKDLTVVSGLGAGGVWLLGQREKYLEILAFFRHQSGVLDWFTRHSVIHSLARAVSVVCHFIWPFLLVVSLSTLAAEIFQIGFTVSFKPLAPRWSRLSLASGMKRIFGIDPAAGSLVPTQLIYSAIKQTFILMCFGGLMIFTSIKLVREELILGVCSFGSEFVNRLGESLSVLLFSFLALGVTWGLSDWLYQRHLRIKRLMMDAEEFKREMRETEGDPGLRSMRKQLHQETLWSEMLHRVRRSKVVIVGESSE